MKNKKKNRGFTLIELLVVISIIGVLSSVILASLNSARKKAQNVATATIINEYVTSIKRHLIDYGNFPSPLPEDYSCLGSDRTTPGFNGCAPTVGTAGDGNGLLEYYPGNPDPTPYNTGAPPNCPAAQGQGVCDTGAMIQYENRGNDTNYNYVLVQWAKYIDQPCLASESYGGNSSRAVPNDGVGDVWCEVYIESGNRWTDPGIIF